VRVEATETSPCPRARREAGPRSAAERERVPDAGRAREKSPLVSACGSPGRGRSGARAETVSDRYARTARCSVEARIGEDQLEDPAPLQTVPRIVREAAEGGFRIQSSAPGAERRVRAWAVEVPFASTRRRRRGCPSGFVAPTWREASRQVERIRPGVRSRTSVHGRFRSTWSAPEFPVCVSHPGCHRVTGPAVSDEATRNCGGFFPSDQEHDDSRYAQEKHRRRPRPHWRAGQSRPKRWGLVGYLGRATSPSTAGGPRLSTCALKDVGGPALRGAGALRRKIEPITRFDGSWFRCSYAPAVLAWVASRDRGFGSDSDCRKPRGLSVAAALPLFWLRRMTCVRLELVSPPVFLAVIACVSAAPMAKAEVGGFHLNLTPMAGFATWDEETNVQTSSCTAGRVRPRVSAAISRREGTWGQSKLQDAMTFAGWPAVSSPPPLRSPEPGHSRRSHMAARPRPGISVPNAPESTPNIQGGVGRQCESSRRTDIGRGVRGVRRPGFNVAARTPSCTSPPRVALAPRGART
jgi:hypothetical protein